MSDDLVKRLRNSRSWLNGGECCGDKCSDGICAAPACIFGEAVKELYEAADRIEGLEYALRSIADTPIGAEIPDRTTIWGLAVHMRETATDALKGGDK